MTRSLERLAFRPGSNGVRHLGARLIAIAALAIASCSRSQPDYGSAANQISEIGNVPRHVKSLAAKMLLSCGVSVKGRSILFQWEAPPGGAPYTLELSRQQFENGSTRSCLDAQTKALGARQELDIGEEPPPAPKEGS